uniref:Uncharacterized protein n=1 Tax=Physcomitrium patens TaxID=3218 RepID=A0A2K1IFW7_PHYPA|nr:hypothetical protein PHYPA_028764 [Physcomitrium patens]
MLSLNGALHSTMWPVSQSENKMVLVDRIALHSKQLFEALASWIRFSHRRGGPQRRPSNS